MKRLLLLDIGNTHTHVALANHVRVGKARDIPTVAWEQGTALRRLSAWVGSTRLEGIALCSVVPRATLQARRLLRARWPVAWFELNARTARAGLGIHYPQPGTLGPDRLANALAARHSLGAPCLAIDFGTAVTFDLVDASGDFVGGIIAPGLGLMTDYLHERTALLPRIQWGPVRSALGRSTEAAMKAGAIYGFISMVRGLIHRLEKELRFRCLPVVATGGYARQVARHVPEIGAVAPRLTLEGVRLAWMFHQTLGP